MASARCAAARLLPRWKDRSPLIGNRHRLSLGRERDVDHLRLADQRVALISCDLPYGEARVADGFESGPDDEIVSRKQWAAVRHVDMPDDRPLRAPDVVG